MAQALFTGATGLRAFQRQLEVVANNLANLNTTGFKADRVLFSDLVYRQIRSGSGANGDDFGGINPAQVGTGVRVSQIDRNFTQGVLQDTGEILDFALRGDGFFVVNDANGQPLYTRAGSFALDERNNLVDPATGYLVRRTGSVGEPNGQNLGFQSVGDTRINIPFGAAIPGVASTQIEFRGNLPSSASPPLAEVLTTSNPFETDTGPATLTTTLSELTSNDSDYEAGDLIEILGTDVDGTAFNISLPADTSTLGDVGDAINAELVDATAELTAEGHLVLTANDVGDGFLSLLIRDDTNNANTTDFLQHSTVIDTEGSAGDIFESTTQVFDTQGNAQNLVFEFQKTSPDTWDVSVELTNSTGEIVNERTYTVSFNDNGTFAFASASAGDTSLDLQSLSSTSLQNIDLNFDQISHTGNFFGLAQNQDGAPAGVLANIAVSSNGIITGVGTNGVEIEVAQLAIGNFSNIDGLEAVGDNYYQATNASGVASIGSAQSGGRGTVVGAQLESSNVDITQEFAQLIVAQRAFSANARTITVADEILDELTNLVR